jgi:hypothetical protein
MFGTKLSVFCREDCIELWMVSYAMATIDNTNDYDNMEDFLNNLRNSVDRPACLRRKVFEGYRDQTGL